MIIFLVCTLSLSLYTLLVLPFDLTDFMLYDLGEATDGAFTTVVGDLLFDLTEFRD